MRFDAALFRADWLRRQTTERAAMLVRVEDRRERLCSVQTGRPGGPVVVGASRLAVVWCDERVWQHSTDPSTGLLGPIAVAWSVRIARACDGRGDVWGCIQWLADSLRALPAPRERVDYLRVWRFGASEIEHYGPMPMREPSCRAAALAAALDGRLELGGGC